MTSTRVIVLFALSVLILCAGAEISPPLELPAELQLDARAPSEVPSEEPVCFDDQVVIRATISNARDLILLNQLSDDPWTHSPGIGGTSDWRISRDKLKVLSGAEIAYVILIDDINELVQSERDRLAQPVEAASWFEDFKNLAAVNAQLDAYVAAHPATCKIVTAGTSIQGRVIRGIRVSRHPEGTVLPGFVFTATQHAREWAGTMTAMWIVDRLVEGDGIDARTTAIVDSSEVFVFPVLNPDGYEYTWVTNRLWRKNRRLNSGGSYGVDMNRNWGFGWGGTGASTSQSNETYRGTAAFSEPETKGFRDWVTPRTNIAASLDIHSYSELLLWPWGYTGTLCPDQSSFNKVGTAMHDAIQAVYGMDYINGPVYSTIYPASGGASDWAYGGAGQLAYSVEVRDLGTYGFIMPASEIIPNAIENFAGIMVMMEQSLQACTITVVAGPSTSIDVGVASLVRATVAVNVGTLIATNPVRLNWQVTGGAKQTVNMNVVGGERVGQLPAFACGESIAWWIEAETNFTFTRWPNNLPGSTRVVGTPLCAIEGDFNFDGSVDAADLGRLLSVFGNCFECPEDFNHNNTVDAEDLGSFLLLL